MAKKTILITVLLIFGFALKSSAREYGKDAVILGRICVSESGFKSYNDCAAIYDVLKDRKKRRGVSFEIAAKDYSARVFDETRRDVRRWLVGLNGLGNIPAGWPVALNWPKHRKLWFELLDYAESLIEGRSVSLCQATPHHWGARYGIDLRRAQEAGAIEVDCGGTLNAFWRMPGLEGR